MRHAQRVHRSNNDESSFISNNYTKSYEQKKTIDRTIAV